MQIYGDTSCEVTILHVARALSQKVASACDLATLRAVLIGCGQLEQLVWDRENTPEALRHSATDATDRAAAAWYAVWSRDQQSAPRPSWDVVDETSALRARLSELGDERSAEGNLNVPEGFAYYALYPEQYAAAAIAYLNHHPGTHGVHHVIGLRSIGTTLSAAVAIVLRAAQVAFRRYTVRPYGHPFDRQLELSTQFGPADSALVVDEGPGLSGSSFFAAARALNTRGVPPCRQ